MMQKFYIIGLSDNREQFFPPEVKDIINKGTVFSGGRRHHGIVSSILPQHYEWIDITIPIDTVFEQYKNREALVVFTSGDPLFYGFANTILRKLPEAEIKVFPTFNSLQTLAHRLLIPYQEMKPVSLTGRKWDALDEALIKCEKLIGVLTDREKTPALIASRMLDYGYDNYNMAVGEALGNRTNESVNRMTLQEALTKEFLFPNCVLLERTRIKSKHFGIPENEFHLLNNRTRMITKMPVRLVTLSLLDLYTKQTFWDIGFCTGSVSIEAKLQFPHLQITAFERRQEGLQLMELNSRKFGTPGIHALIGDFMDKDLGSLPSPDAVFIGGHGGLLTDMIKKIGTVLPVHGTIVFNSVSEESERMFREGIRQINRKVTTCICLVADENNPIKIIKAE